MNEMMWLNRYNGKRDGRNTFDWVQVAPLYSEISTRLLYVMDPERGRYPVLAKELRTQKPEGATR